MTPQDVAPPKTVRRVWIDAGAVRAVLAAYGAAGAHEPCGLLLGAESPEGVQVVEAPALANVHSAPDRAFLISPEEQLRVAREGKERNLEVVGAWHGHVRGGPWPGYADEDAATGESPTRLRVLLIVGRGAGGRPVLRAFAPGRRGLREVPLRL